MSTEATQQMIDNNSISKSDSKMSCAPRNALFCCSSPVCLNNSTVPRILPVDYQQCMNNSNLLLVPNEKQQQQQQQQQQEQTQDSQEVIVPLSDNVQKRISTYDFPIYCENKINIQQTQHSTSATPSMALSSQTIQNTKENAIKPVEKSKNSSLHNQKNESNSSTFGTRNEFQSKVATRSPTSSISLSSSSPSMSPPPVLPAQRSKPSKAINELARILKSENSNNNCNKSAQQSLQQKHLTSCKFPPDKEEACTPTTIKALEQGGERGTINTSSTAPSKFALPTDSGDFYSAEIDYMNNYLRSLPDYSELDKKIHKEFQKCEDIYDQIQSINTGIAAKNQQQPLLESSSHPKVTSQFSYPGPQKPNLTRNVSVKILPEQGDRSVITSSSINKTNYPSIFSSDKNKLTRSVSSSNMSTQSYPIDHPDIPGFLPKLPQNTSGNLFRFNKGGIQKSSSNSCLTRPMGKQLMNDFWSENVADKNKKKTGWNYEKIMASPGAESKKSVAAANMAVKSDPKVNKLQKDISLSSIDSKIRENVSKEELYNLICNNVPPDQKHKPVVQQRIHPQKVTQKDIENIPGFMNLNKSVSLSNMPGIGKSSNKSHIPCYMKQLPPLSKSTSNSQLPLKQIYSNQVLGENNSSKKSSGTSKIIQLQQEPQTHPTKGVFKSSSSSCVFGNKYQPFQQHKHGPPLHMWNHIPGGGSDIHNDSEKISKNHEVIIRSVGNNKQVKNNTTAIKSMVGPHSSNQNQKVQGMIQPITHESCKQNLTKKPSENTPLTRVSSSLHISIGSQSQHSNNSYKTPISYQSTSNTNSNKLPQTQPNFTKPNCTKNQSFKPQTESDMENSKKQKEAENNIEKCLNEMLKITSNYNAPPPPPPSNTTKSIESHQPTGTTGNKVQHKPFPIGKSNSTSSMQQHLYHPLYHDAHNQMRNKKQMPGWNVTVEHRNLPKAAPPVTIPQYNQNAASASVKNYQQQTHLQKQSAVNMPTGLQKSATSGNVHKEIGGNKNGGNVDTFNSITHVVASIAPSNSLSSSSYVAYPVRKKTSSSVGKTSTFSSNNDIQRIAINKTQNNVGNAYYDDKLQSDILQTFDPYFYHNQQPPGTLPKNNNPMPDLIQYDDQICMANKQKLSNDPRNQMNSNKSQMLGTTSIVRPNQPLDLPVQIQQQQQQQQHQQQQQQQQLLQSSLIRYDYPPLSDSQSSSYFDSSCDIASSAEHFFEQPKPTIQDDADGHLIYHTGDILHNRYKIMATLGEGTFGRVVKVKDMERDHCMALKIIKNVEKYREAAKLEINALEKIAQKDPNCDHLCVRMIDWFDYHGHMCIAFEMLGLSVFDFLRENNYEPYPLDQVRHMGYQLCYAVKFLHDNRLTHTDLKPENILFVDSEYTTHYNHKKNREVRRVKCTDVRLIDFGSATFDHEHHSTIVSTRHYRAPEVILELGWSQPCDVWSIGCILFELYLGITLFQTHDNREHLAMMERILGQIPYRMARKTKTKYFYHGKLDWDEKSSAGRYVRDHCKPLFRYLMSDSEDHVQLFDLIKKMLEYEPSQRITLGEALRHPFFEKLPPHQRIGDTGKIMMSGSSSRERSHSLSR